MSSNPTQANLLNWLRRHLDVLLSGESPAQATAAHLPDDPQGQVVTEKLRSLISTLETLPGGIKQYFRYNHYSPQERSVPPQFVTAIELADEASKHYLEIDLPQISEFCRLIQITCRLLTKEVPPSLTSNSGSLFSWQRDVKNFFDGKEFLTESTFKQYQDYCASSWEVFESAQSLGLRTWTVLARQFFLSISEVTLPLAARLNRLANVTKLRGLYLAAWRYEIPSEEDDREPRASGPYQWEQLGFELGRMHAQAEAPDSPGLPSLAARQFDIEILFRGDTPESRQEFIDGYTAAHDNGSKSPLSITDLSKAAKGRRPVEHYGIEAPNTPPSLNVRLCAFALRNNVEVGRSLTEQLDSLQRAEPSADRAIRAAVLTSESADINENVAAAAVRLFFNDVQDLHSQARLEDVKVAVKRGMLYLKGIVAPSISTYIEALNILSLLHTDPDPATAAESRLVACRLLTESGFPEALYSGRHKLLGMAGDPALARRYGDVITLLISNWLKSLLLERQLAHARELRRFLQNEVRLDQLGAEHRSIVEACKTVLDQLLLPSGSHTISGLDKAIELAARHEVLKDLVGILMSLRPPGESAGGVLSSYLRAGVSAETYDAVCNEDWPSIVEFARRDLRRKPRNRSSRLLLVGNLALALRKLTETDPGSAASNADEVLSLLNEYADDFLSHVPDSGDADAGAWAVGASDLALAAVVLFQSATSNQPFPSMAILLLETAVKVTPLTLRPVEHATYLHDLGHAYRQCSAYLPANERFVYLEKAAALFRESLIIYRDLRQQPQFLSSLRSRPEHIDYMNLGQAYLSLARLSNVVDSDIIGPYTSPIYLRAALCVLAMARDIALENQYISDAASASLSLAQVSSELALACLEHTRANRGALRRDFNEWLCVIEGPVLSTWDFANRYASFALGQIVEALHSSLVTRDFSLTLHCIQALFSVWKVAEMRHGVSGARILFDDNWWNMHAFRNNGLITIAETIDELVEAMSEAPDSQILDELSEYRRYFAGRIQLELFEHLGNHSDDLVVAESHFNWLKNHGNVISRALTRPLANWFYASDAPGGMGFNGLFIGNSANGLELRVLSLRRNFVIEGLRVRDLALTTWTSSWIKTNSTSAVADSLPQIDWSQVPAVVPAVTAICEAGSQQVNLLAVRLPTTSWDTWVLHLGLSGDGLLEFGLPPSFTQIKEPAAKAPPEAKEEEAQVLVLEADGIVLEISVRGVSNEDPVNLDIECNGDGTLIRARAKELTISLRTTPGIVDGDVATIAKMDEPFAVACSSATFPLISPQTNLPSSLMRIYSPLFLFDTHVDEKVIDHIARSSYREIIVVGIPSAPEQLDNLLLKTFDPRRDFYFLLRSEEIPQALAALERFYDHIRRLMGAPLFDVAASIDEDVDAFANVQFVEVERPLAPAAAQMLLDITAFRRLPLEDLPIGGRGMPYPFQILGDPAGMRRALTQLPNPANWNDLLQKYVELTSEIELERIGSDDSAAGRAQMEAFSRPIQKRNHVIVPYDSGLVLACIPYARHLGAFLVPDTKEAWAFIEATYFQSLYVVKGCENVPPQYSTVELPGTYTEIAARFAELARNDHELRMRALELSHEAKGPSTSLAARMQPNKYVVLASVSGTEYWAAAIAANYAAALGAPLLLFDDESVFSIDVKRRTGNLLTLDSKAARSLDPASRHLVPYKAPEPLKLDSPYINELDRAISAMDPQYVGVVSNRLTMPLEFIGSPPLATRYAVGRLCAPDLTSLALLMSAAALTEEVPRNPRISVLITEAADAVKDRFLPGAREEAAQLKEMLSHTADVVVTEIVGDDDLAQFLTLATNAQIVHFSGHGSYDDQHPTESSIIFRGGNLRAADVPANLAGFPIVFSNACDTGVVYNVAEAGRGWSGLAAAFIKNGAVNYIGSLWPIFDESSRRLAEEFYSLLNKGYSSGEALLRAKQTAYKSGDPTWAAMVLFGCPRNRIRAGSPTF